MKYAVISDIHANIAALKLVLQDAAKQGAEHYIFLGDYCNCFPFNNEVIALLRAIPNANIVKGNHEDYLFNWNDAGASMRSSGQFEAVRHTYESIEKENFAFLQKLKAKDSIFSSNAADIYMAHKIEEFIVDDVCYSLNSHSFSYAVENGTQKEHEVSNYVNDTLSSAQSFLLAIEKLPQGIYLFGHSHLQWSFEHEGRLLINPGSCGIALDYKPSAAYTMLNIEKSACEIEHRRLEYDFNLVFADEKYLKYEKEMRVFAALTKKELKTATEQVRRFINFAEQYAESINDTVRPFSKATWEQAFEKWLIGQEK